MLKILDLMETVCSSVNIYVYIFLDLLTNHNVFANTESYVTIV
jgi:hypothetical protein